MVSPTLPYTETATTIDAIGPDLLQNIVAKLPGTSFTSAACVNRSWNILCDRILSRPNLSSASSFNPSLQVAVEEVVNKVLSRPIRPHFAIASVSSLFDLQEAHQLISTRLGSQVPVITNSSCGIIGRDAVSDEFKEVLWDNGRPEAPIVLSESENGAIMLVVGFLPGLKVGIIPLLKPTEIDATLYEFVFMYRRQEYVWIDKFVIDISKFSNSVSGCQSPAAMIISCCHDNVRSLRSRHEFLYGKNCLVLLKWLSPETVIVGDSGCQFRHTAGVNGNSRNSTVNEDHVSAAVALVFVVDKNKNPDI
ncbi:hypothetical protein QVD17_16431 [Tagetes erecta]|uniref:F-box domain-containing protein n=1 Tax=Tagetes erecta TaxID=13708 RepID=A0AAD8KWS1_TARER|nr:hypothetical protein QVD17_16431 [Tagetes erecta]